MVGVRRGTAYLAKERLELGTTHLLPTSRRLLAISLDQVECMRFKEKILDVLQTRRER